jgi:hypothetical protein
MDSRSPVRGKRATRVLIPSYGIAVLMATMKKTASCHRGARPRKIPAFSSKCGEFPSGLEKPRDLHHIADAGISNSHICLLLSIQRQVP